MGSHFSCIGLQTPDREAFGRLIESLVDDAVEDACPPAPSRHLRWTDSSGASLALHLGKDDAVECVTPFFAPQDRLSRWSVRTSGPAPDPKCEHCGGADCDILDAGGDMVTRAAVQFLHFVPYREWLSRPRSFELEVTAFAHQAAFYETSAQFAEGQRRWWARPGEPEPKMPDGRPMRFAENAFMPEGMFAGPESGMTERATATFAGRVAASARLTNGKTGSVFRRVRVETLAGPLDALLNDPEGEPEPGKIAFIRAWLVGRPVTAPETGVSHDGIGGFLRRLSGRTRGS